MRDSREDIRQTRVNSAVGGRVSGVVQRRFLGGVRREEAGVVAVFVVRERNKAEIRGIQTRGFPGSSPQRDFHLVARAQIVKMDRQILHGATGLRTTDLHAPAVINKLFTILAAKANDALVHRYFS